MALRGSLTCPKLTLWSAAVATRCTMSNLLESLTNAKKRQRVNRNMMAVVARGGALKGELTDVELFATQRAWERLAGCASDVTVGIYFDGDQPRQRLLKARFCGNATVCPVCSKRRGYLAATRYHPRILGSLAAHEESVLAMLTLTLENQDNLRAGLELLATAWRAFTMRGNRYRSNPDKNPYSESVKILGSVRSYEVKRARDIRFWHPHLHAAVILTEYIDREALSAEWRKLTGGSFIVHVRRIVDLRKGLKEVLKYPCKFGELSAEDHVRVWRAFRGIAEGKRILAMSSTGCLRGVQFNEEDLDADEPVVDVPRLVDHWVWMNDRHYEHAGSRFESPEMQADHRAWEATRRAGREDLEAARRATQESGIWREHSFTHTEGLAEERALWKQRQARKRLPDPVD